MIDMCKELNKSIWKRKVVKTVFSTLPYQISISKRELDPPLAGVARGC